ncbi:MAG: hypothetical protein U9Q66_04040 [Patescibacteria group bacterium]|nr:hypothetical protein [Patescibacteria group bacterium]
MDKFTDFPDIGKTSGDISLNQSEFGKTFVKVAISSEIYEDRKYILVYKTFDINGKFIEIKTVENVGISEFNIEVNSLNAYKFCIASVQNDTIMEVSPIEELFPGEMLGKSASARSIARQTELSGVDVLLDVDAQSFPYCLEALGVNQCNFG